MPGEQVELVQQDVVRRREVGYEQIRVVVPQRICRRCGTARLVFPREARYRAHDKTDAIVIEQGGLSLDRLQGTACQSAPGCVLDDRQGKHAAIFDSAEAIGKRARAMVAAACSDNPAFSNN